MASMAELKVTPSQLKSKANDFKGKANSVRTTTNSMLNEIKTITGQTWSGDAAEAYKKRFARLEKDMEQMYKMITEYSDDLMDIAAQYEATERINETLSNALATDVIN